MQSGANASRDDIDRQAGVGAGTLYRHFPSRDALIEAVYRTEVEKLAARTFAKELPPREALRAWMLLFVDYIAAQHIIAPALNSLAGGASKLYEGSRSHIQGAIDLLVKRAIKSGDLRKDIDPFDLARALIDRVFLRNRRVRSAAKRPETRAHPHRRLPPQLNRFVRTHRPEV